MKKLIAGCVLSFILLLSACDLISVSEGQQSTIDDLLELDTIVVPHYGYDGVLIRTTVGEGDKQTTYIKKAEMTAMIKAVEIVVGAGKNIGDFDGTFRLADLAEENGHSKVLDSAIFHATLTKTLLEIADEHGVVIPYYDDAGEPLRVLRGAGEEETVYLTKDEIQATVNALHHVLGDNALLDDFEGALKLSRLTEDTGVSMVFESAIVHATITQQLYDLAENDDLLVIPHKDEDDAAIRQKVGVNEGVKEFEYIKKTELQALINAFELIVGTAGTIEDFDGNVPISDFVVADASEPHRIFDSAILHATLSREILALENGNADYVIPYVDATGDDIRISRVSGAEITTYVRKTEVQALINALAVLLAGANDFADFAGGFDLSLIYAPDIDPLLHVDERDTLLASAIIHATLSGVLIDLDDVDGLIVVPAASENELVDVRIPRGDPGEETVYVDKEEIKQLIHAFVLMDYATLDDFGTGIDSSKFFDHRVEYLESHIIHATVSYKMLNDTLGNLIVPDIVREVTTAGDIYIKKTEVLAILDALEDFGLTNFSAIDMTPATLLDEDYDIHIMASSTIQATISKFILDVAEDESVYNDPAINNTLVVPTTRRVLISVDAVDVDQIEQTELIALLDAIKILDFVAFDEAFDGTAITNLDSTTLADILESASIHVTIDVMLKDNDNLDVPNRVLVEYYDLPEWLVEKDELDKLLKAVQASGQSDFTVATFDAAMLPIIAGYGSAERETIFASVIVQKTMTPHVHDAIDAYNFANPGGEYFPSNSDYHDDDPLTFFTSAGIENALVGIGLVS